MTSINLVGLIGTYSKKEWLREAFANLHDQLSHSPPRSPRSTQPRRHALKHRIKQAERADIVAKYGAGISSNQLVVEHQLAKGTVLKILREDGANIRRKGLRDEHLDEATRLYRSGRSLAWIGNHLDVSPTTVRNSLVKQGITLRDPHGRERSAPPDVP